MCLDVALTSESLITKPFHCAPDHRGTVHLPSVRAPR